MGFLLASSGSPAASPGSPGSWRRRRRRRRHRGGEGGGGAVELPGGFMGKNPWGKAMGNQHLMNDPWEKSWKTIWEIAWKDVGTYENIMEE